MKIDIIDRYIHEVQRRIPEKQRHDIGKEMRSTIEDMLPQNPNEHDVKNVLNELGNPAKLASHFNERPMYLIGPRYFDLYHTLFKMIAPIALIISLISLFGQYFGPLSEEVNFPSMIGSLILDGILIIIDVAIQLFFWLTFIFTVMERLSPRSEEPLTTSFREWTADDLKHVGLSSAQPPFSKFYILVRLCWLAIWATVYFNANHLIGVYEYGKLTIPVFNQNILQSYWPLVVLVIVGELITLFVKALEEKWTGKVAMLQIGLEIITTVIFVFIITRAKLFNPEFAPFMASIFNTTATDLMNLIIFGAIAVSILATGLAVYDAWKKSRVS